MKKDINSKYYSKITAFTFGVLFYSAVLTAQVYTFNFERLEMLYSDSFSIYKGNFTFEFNQQLKSVSLSKKYDAAHNFSEEKTEMTFRKKKDTIINNEKFKIYFINGDPDFIYEADKEEKIAISENKLYYFTDYDFHIFAITQESIPNLYMLKANKKLVKMERKPSSYDYNKDSPKIRTKEEVIKDESKRTSLEKAWECNKIWSASLWSTLESLGIFLFDSTDDAKEKQKNENWIKREFDLLERTGKLVINCSYISGSNFHLENNNGCSSISWTDSITKSAFYSNKAFKQLDWKLDPMYGGSSIYNFQGGARTPDYNLSWQLIKSNEDQSYRLFRNCYSSYIFEIRKIENFSQLSFTLTQIPEIMRDKTDYFVDCKNAQAELQKEVNLTEQYYLPESAYNKASFHTPNTDVTRVIYYTDNGNETYDIMDAHMFQGNATAIITRSIKFIDDKVVMIKSASTSIITTNKKQTYEPAQVLLKMPVEGQIAKWSVPGEDGDMPTKYTSSWTTLTIDGQSKKAIKVVSQITGWKSKLVSYYVQGMGLTKTDFIDEKGITKPFEKFDGISYEKTTK